MKKLSLIPALLIGLIINLNVHNQSNLNVAMISNPFENLEKIDKNFKKQTFSNNINLSNDTDFEVDTIIYILTDKIFNLDSLTINIKYFDIFYFEVNCYGAVIPDENFNTYNVFLNRDLCFESLKLVLSHEFVHIKQFENNLSIKEYDDFAIFNNDTIVFSEVEYRERPYEIEAFNLQDSIYNELNNILY